MWGLLHSLRGGFHVYMNKVLMRRESKIQRYHEVGIDIGLLSLNSSFCCVECSVSEG